MSQELFEVLKHSKPAEARKRLGLSARELDAQVLQLIPALNGQGESESPEQRAIFNYVAARSSEPNVEAQQASQPRVYPPELRELREWARRIYAPESVPVTPEILEWARRTFNEEEFLASVREIERTGGLELKDILDELEQEAKPRE